MNKTVTGIEHREFSIEPGFFNDKINLVVPLDLWSYAIGEGCEIALEPYGDQRFSELPPFDPFHNSVDYDIVKERLTKHKMFKSRMAVSIRSTVIEGEHSCVYSRLDAMIRSSFSQSTIGGVKFYSLISKESEGDSQFFPLGKLHAERLNYLKLAGILVRVHKTQEWGKGKALVDYSNLGMDTIV